MNELFRLSPSSDQEEIDPVFRAYYHAKVTIYYREAGYNDTGKITYLDGSWVELTKPTGERFLIPHSGIRIIKLLELAKPEGDAAILLRPVEGKTEIPQIESRQKPTQKWK